MPRLDQDAMNEAYIAVTEEQVGIKAANRRFGVPYSSLQRRVSGKYDLEVDWERKSLMTAEHEELLAEHLKKMARHGYGYSHRETLKLASSYALNLGIKTTTDPPLGLSRLRCFLSRHPDLTSICPRKRYQKVRQHHTGLTQFCKFIQSFMQIF